ncbi:mandelate racemase/muconate lactonizing enzyme family protein [Phycisphaerales bacterium AB-hyl4]|uniref:Mandelate racemase/muconate lactonizing enzyme family protein n=1 Tax=Natronomicrosphaera hydrolytica TaxID=3242702 RepID=A0ABV4U459_9BACT
MKITNVRCHLLTTDLRQATIVWAGGSIPYWNTALIEVETDAGVSGLGEAYYPGLSAPRPTQAMTDNFATLLVGENPLDIARLFHKMRAKSYAWGKAGLPLMVAGTIENALWDILGQVQGVPVWQLLGGRCHDGIMAYASGGNDAPDALLQDEMRSYVERGFKAVKIRIGRSVKEDVHKVALCREALGPDVHLMVDAVMGHNPQPLTAKQALERARAVEPYDITWFEDPVNNRDYAGCAFVRQQTSIPIAAGETAVGVHEFLPFFEADAVDYIQPDPTHSGGILECLDIRALARAHGVRVIYHSWGMAPCLSANYNLAFADPYSTFVEYPTHGMPLVDELAIEPFEIVNGMLQAPTQPGLGVRLTPEILENYAYVDGSIFWP